MVSLIQAPYREPTKVHAQPIITQNDHTQIIAWQTQDCELIGKNDTAPCI